MYKKYKPLMCLGVLALALFTSCKEESLDMDLFSGLWIQKQITEDGQVMNLSDKEKTLRLLIEANGVYRSFATDGTTPDERYGTWIVTDDKWIDFTVDTWHVKTQPTETKEGEWGKNHLMQRFTLLSITEDQMEIRIKTYVGEKKYAALFVEQERPALTVATIEGITTAFKTYRTYVFTFQKAK